MNPTSDSKTEPYNIEQIRTYCRLEVKPELADMQWDRLEEATRSTIETIKSTHRSQLLVDLSHLPTIRSGTVASLVRIWKSLNKKSRRFVVVSPHDRVRRELESAGLQKLWTIVANREEAAYELGVSRRAEREERELRILALAAFPCSLLAVLATVMMFRDSKEAIQVNAQLAALLLGAVSLTVGIVSVLKDAGFRRMLSALAIVVSLFALSTLFFERNPISFRSSVEPSREIESE
ncbi:MAG: STAS domain-containing protein [Planctomycetes bacterium]|nr:STAS domain-containing protein [Planctomycetota bacterium]MBL7044601.1 STAS domain-containing protein [Pirellulaceae bacterium]